MNGSAFGAFMSGGQNGVALGKGIKDAQDRRALEKTNKLVAEGGLTPAAASDALDTGINTTIGAASTGIPAPQAVIKGIDFGTPNDTAQPSAWANIAKAIGIAPGGAETAKPKGITFGDA